MRTVAAPVNLIVAGNAIVVTIVVVVIVSRDMAAEGRVGGAIPPLSLSSSALSAVVLYLIPPLNVCY